MTWLGRPGERVRIEFDREIAGVVVPAVEGDRVALVHAAATDRYLVTAHQGSIGVLEDLARRVPHDRPANPLIGLFLMLEGAVETFRRPTEQIVGELEDLEEEMFEQTPSVAARSFGCPASALGVASSLARPLRAGGRGVGHADGGAC